MLYSVLFYLKFASTCLVKSVTVNKTITSNLKNGKAIQISIRKVMFVVVNMSFSHEALLKTLQYIHTYLIDHSPLGLFMANETNNWNKLHWLSFGSESLYSESKVWKPHTATITTALICLCVWIYLSSISKISARIWSGFQVCEKTFDTTRLQAEGFYCFWAVRNLMNPKAQVF